MRKILVMRPAAAVLSSLVIVFAGLSPTKPVIAQNLPTAEELQKSAAADSAGGTAKSAADNPDAAGADSTKVDDAVGNSANSAADINRRIDEFVKPDETAAKAYPAPPDAKQLSGRNLWIDRKLGRVYCDGYVAMREGPLEMFACGVGTKEHEAIVAVIPKANEIHTALLAVGATQGTPVRIYPEYLPATGQRIRVWVSYRDEAGQFHSTDARQWIINDGKVMDVDWVFAGSKLWTDPADNKTYYQANGGDMICVSNFSTAMMDVPVTSSASAGELMYGPMTNSIPPQYTAVRLTLVPIPIPPATTPDAETPPAETVLGPK